MIFVSNVSREAAFSLKLQADYRGTGTEDQLRHVRREIVVGMGVEEVRRYFAAAAQTMSKRDFATALSKAASYRDFVSRG